MGKSGFSMAAAAVVMTTTGAALGAAGASPVPGEGISPGSAVAVVVKVPAPWYAPRFLVARRMRDTIPEYQSLPGLNFKAYSFARADGHYGGIYLWKDVAAARAWFSPKWFERVERERGAPADVRFLEVWLAIDNTPGGTPSSSDGPAVATVVEIPLPAGVGRDRIVEGFAAAAPTFRSVPGLLRKYFITTPQGRFGGVYLWQDEASARAWFTQAWHERVQSQYGQPASVEWFDTPILLPGMEGNGTWVKGVDRP